MKRFIAVGSLALMLPFSQISAETNRAHLYLCRSPLLAFDFWNTLLDIKTRGVTVTPKITEEVCNNMRAGKDPQCIRVEAETFKPISSGWGGALALTDGKTKVWFRNPDAGGWVHPDYYVTYVNSR
jgi:hypothetical protein